MRCEIVNPMERKIIQSLLDVVILLELRKRSLSGYDIQTLVLEEFRRTISTGTIYGQLYVLERQEYDQGKFRFRR